MKKSLLIVCGLAIAAAVEAQIIHVPEDYPTIQQGINAAASGDTILVAEGTYYENINFLGKKPLIVTSEFLMDADTNHISNTIINGSQPANPDSGSVVIFTSGEDTTSVLCGFTITGGTGTFLAAAGNGRAGGGLFITGSGGKLLNNHIENNFVYNEGWVSGGGITAAGPDVPLEWLVLRNNRINNNQAISENDLADGGGFYGSYNLILKDNQISYNRADGYLGGNGGGVVVIGSGPIEIDISENEITHNEAEATTGTMNYNALGGGISLLFDITGHVSDNVISYNRINAPGNHVSHGAGAFIEYITSNGFVFENNIVNQNFAITTQNCHGGGLSLYRSGGLYQNNVIQNNSVSHAGGINIMESKEVSDTAILINNTITGNSATFGGGIEAIVSNVVLINTIIWNNTASYGISIRNGGSNLEVRYSDVEGDDAWPGEGNVLCAPQFLADGYHLDYTCMLLNKGISSIVIDSVTYNSPQYDIDGDLRPYWGEAPEIGADELLTAEPIGKLISPSIDIYPNPASEKINIELTGEKFNAKNSVSVLDITGQELILQKVTGSKTEIDISSLPAGVYFIRLVGNDHIAPLGVGKFVKY